jgi:class 3 adenylate cyclase
VATANIPAPPPRGAAAAGEILIAQRTYAAIDGQVPAVPVGDRKLKGFSRPMPVYSVGADGAGAAADETSELAVEEAS